MSIIGSRSEASTRSIYVALGLCAFLVAVTASWSLELMGGTPPQPGTTTRAYCLLVGVAFSLCALGHLLVSREPLLGPLGLFLIALTIWFGVRAALVAVLPTMMVHTDAMSDFDRWNDVLHAQLLVVLWAAMAVIVYHAPLGRWLERKVADSRFVRRTFRASALRAALLLYFLGVVGNAYRVFTGAHLGIIEARPESAEILYSTGYDVSSIVFGTLFPMLGTLGLLLVVTLTVRDRRWWVLGVVLMLELIYGFLSGVRGGLLMTGAVVAIALYLFRRLTALQIGLLSPVVIVLAFAVVAPYRHVIGVMNLAALERIDLSTIGEHIRTARALGWGDLMVDPSRFLRDAVASRFAGVDRFAGAIHAIRSEAASFVHGETLIRGAVSSLPRLLVPDRPVLNLGAWFHVEYLNAPEDTQTVVPMARVIESYVNFGVGGVLVGGAFMGAVLRGIRGLLTARTAVAVVLYLFAASQFVLLSEKPLSSQMTLWKPAVLLVVAVWWLTYANRDTFAPWKRSTS